MKNFWQKYKTALIILLVIVVAGGVFFLARAKGGANEVSYKTVKVERGSLTATVGATGTARSNQTAKLIWQTSGRVEAVHVQVGESVSAGTVLATLAPDSVAQNIILAQADLVNAQRALDDLMNSSLQQAQAQMNLVAAEQALDDAQEKVDALQYKRASQDTIDNTRAQLDLAEKQVTLAEQVYKRYQNRPDGDAKKAEALLNLTNARLQRDQLQATLNWYLGTPDDLDIAEREAKLALAQAKYEDAKREWERVKDGPTEEDIAAAQARVDAAQAALNLARLAAPFDGTITFVNVKPGDEVSPGMVGFRMDDLSRLLVDVEISEVDINSVQVGQEVTMTFDAVLGKEYHGKVVEVGAVGENAQGAVNFTVTVEITDADESVKPGMTAAVNIVVKEVNDAILVPNRAVRVVNGKRVVYLLKDGAPQMVEIRLGASSDTMSVVVSNNIHEGDLVILNPPTDMGNPGHPPFMGGGK